MITSDEIINAADKLSINVSAIIMRTISTNFQNKKGRYKMDCYILHTVLLLIILLFIIAIVFIIKYMIGQNWKKHCLANNIKTENNEFSKVRI